MPDLAHFVYYLGVHLLYASLVWCGAWVLCSWHSGSATTKYWIWLATALNFVIPSGAIIDRVWSSHLAWARPLVMIGAAGGAANRHRGIAAAAGLVWLSGAALMLLRLGLRLRRERRSAAVGRPLATWRERGIPVRVASDGQAPAVAGLWHPHISLPAGIDRLLSAAELDAVLLHELTHARRRDNLVRLIYELGLCLVWFHPLLWVSGSRLALFRELSCDESAIDGNHGRDLISALGKLASPLPDILLRASAGSLVRHRLARLARLARMEARPGRQRAADMLLTALFSAVVLGGVVETIGHTACCFVTGR